MMIVSFRVMRKVNKKTTNPPANANENQRKPTKTNENQQKPTKNTNKNQYI